MNIIITLIIIAIPLGIYLFKRKKDKEFDERRAEISREVNLFTGKELAIVIRCNELFDYPDVDVVMVRSETQPILHYYGQTWDAVNKPAAAFYSHLHKTIFIKSYETDLLRFLKLYVHEMHHHLGGPSAKRRARSW